MQTIKGRARTLVIYFCLKKNLFYHELPHVQYLFHYFIPPFSIAVMADGSRTMEDRARKLLYSTRLSIAGLACGIAIWLLFLILIIVSAAS